MLLGFHARDSITIVAHDRQRVHGSFTHTRAHGLRFLFIWHKKECRNRDSAFSLEGCREPPDRLTSRLAKPAGRRCANQEGFLNLNSFAPMNFRFLLAAAAGLLCAACSEYTQFPIATVGHVALPRY